MENQYIKNATPPYHFDEGDDGSLSSLGIDTDRDRKTFNCKAIRQTDLIDKYRVSGWLKYCDTKNLVKTINRKGNGEIIK